MYYKGPPSDHFDGKQFFNPWFPYTHSLWTVIKWRLTCQPKPWPKKLPGLPSTMPSKRVEGTQLKVTFIGHSTTLIQTENLNILTDPIWSESASPFGLGIKRARPPGVKFEDLPPIDLVLITHNHYDHMDMATIGRLTERDDPLFLTPLGNDAIIKSKITRARIVALDWSERHVFKDLTILLEPSQHWSSRKGFDKNQALWGAFVLSTPNGNIYYAGDTGYADIFKWAKEKYGEFRLAILPIGAYEPRWFMKPFHMNPDDAVKAYFDLGEPQTIAVHFGTFKLSDEGIDEPILDLKQAMDKHHVDPTKIAALQPGEEIFI